MATARRMSRVAVGRTWDTLQVAWKPLSRGRTGSRESVKRGDVRVDVALESASAVERQNSGSAVKSPNKDRGERSP